MKERKKKERMNERKIERKKERKKKKETSKIKRDHLLRLVKGEKKRSMWQKLEDKLRQKSATLLSFNIGPVFQE